MRHAAILLVLVVIPTILAASCVVPLENNNSTGTGGSASVCEPKDNCQDCLDCATNGPCSAQWQACLQDSICNGINQCVAVCGGDAACEQQCYDNNPSGVQAYFMVTNCAYCQQCPKACPEHANCP